MSSFQADADETSENEDRQSSDTQFESVNKDRQSSDTQFDSVNKDRQSSDTSSPSRNKDRQRSDTSSPSWNKVRQSSDTSSQSGNKDRQSSDTSSPSGNEVKRVEDTCTTSYTTQTVMCTSALTIVLISIASAAYFTRRSPMTTLVKTSCGQIRGIASKQGFEFRGIPYAVPPAGPLRWKPPEELKDKTCWEGTRDSTAFGNSCFQTNIFKDKFQSAYFGSEDCLYLNVWTPARTADAKLPVAVFVHGGGLTNFNGNWPLYSPTSELAHNTQVVFVSMNYRLHAFGFMALDVLSKQSRRNVSGNYGYMDVQLALKWVQKNIDNFGGDPEEVALFGHSSGGTAVMALMTSPLSRGLFHRAWVSSGSGYYKKSLNEAAQDNLVFLRKTGCTDIDCLHRLSPERITDAVPWNEYPDWSKHFSLDLPEKNIFSGAICVVDGYVIPNEPVESLSGGFAMNIPLLIGSTAEERDLFPVPTSVKTWSWDNYTDYVTTKLNTFSSNVAEEALVMYPAHGDTSVECLYTSLVSDIRATCPTQQVCHASASCTPTYYYFVTHRPSQPIAVEGFYYPAVCSFHFLDVFAFFGVIDRLIDKPTTSDLSFQSSFQTEAVYFLKHGKPKSWESWETFPHKTAMVDKRVTLVDGVHKSKECLFWNNRGFYKYGWPN